MKQRDETAGVSVLFGMSVATIDGHSTSLSTTPNSSATGNVTEFTAAVDHGWLSNVNIVGQTGTGITATATN